MHHLGLPACATSGAPGPSVFILFAGLWLLQHLGKGDLGATLTLSPHGSGRHSPGLVDEEHWDSGNQP